ncbi:MAG: hypothetical protein AAF449_15010 [Myxococcota bacterium]
MRTPNPFSTSRLTLAAMLAAAVACGGLDAEHREDQRSITLSLKTTLNDPPTLEGIEWQPIGPRLFEGRSDDLDILYGQGLPIAARALANINARLDELGESNEAFSAEGARLQNARSLFKAAIRRLKDESNKASDSESGPLCAYADYALETELAIAGIWQYSASATATYTDRTPPFFGPFDPNDYATYLSRRRYAFTSVRMVTNNGATVSTDSEIEDLPTNVAGSRTASSYVVGSHIAGGVCRGRAEAYAVNLGGSQCPTVVRGYDVLIDLPCTSF